MQQLIAKLFGRNLNPMTMDPTPPDTVWPPHLQDAAGELAALSETVRRTLAMATELAVAGRWMDMTGLDRTVGLLCATALDLQPGEGRLARAGLIALLTEIDAFRLTIWPPGSA